MNLRDVHRFVEVPWKHHDDYISYAEFPLPLSLNMEICPIDVCIRGVSTPVIGYLTWVVS